MDITHEVHDGFLYRKFLSVTFEPIQWFKKRYDEEGKLSWVNPYDEKRWQLYVQLGRVKTKEAKS